MCACVCGCVRVSKLFLLCLNKNSRRTGGDRKRQKSKERKRGRERERKRHSERAKGCKTFETFDRKTNKKACKVIERG